VLLADQWQEIETALPQGWSSAQLSLTVAEDADADRVALILASLTPGRMGTSFRLEVTPSRNPEGIVRRLDQEGVRGRLDLISTDAAAAEVPVAEPPHRQAALTRQWDELVGDLPQDWSELYAEVELASSDFLPRAALLLAPVNPARYGGVAALRFRSARVTGYGVAPEMTRRCFERLDSENITGSLRALRVLSHTSHVSTQGPVWRVGGRSV
jgi:hypothetical protein